MMESPVNTLEPSVKRDRLDLLPRAHISPKLSEATQRNVGCRQGSSRNLVPALQPERYTGSPFRVVGVGVELRAEQPGAEDWRIGEGPQVNIRGNQWVWAFIGHGASSVRQADIPSAKTIHTL